MKWNFICPPSGGAHCAIWTQDMPWVFDINLGQFSEYVSRKHHEQQRMGSYSPSFESGLIKLPFSARLKGIFEDLSIDHDRIIRKWESYMNANTYEIEACCRLHFPDADDAMLLKLRWDSDTDSA